MHIDKLEANHDRAGDESDSTQLPRRLGVFGLAFIFIAFNAPLAVLAGYLQPAIAFGNGIGAPVAFLAAGGLLALFQVGLLAMTRHMKSPGAFYTYIAEGLGKAPALAGSVLAAVAYVLFTVTCHVFFGLIMETALDQVFGGHLMPWQGWSLVGIAIVTVLNLLRIDFTAKIIGIFVTLEILVVLVYQAVVLVKGGPEGYSASSFAPTEFLSGNAGLAVLFAITTMIGIEAMAVFREEARDPDRTVPRAAYSAIGFTTVFFALAAWAYIVAVGPSQAVEDARTAPVDSVLGTVQTYLGSVFPTLVSVLLVTSQIAACNSTQAAGVRYLFSFGQDRILPQSLGRVHHKLGSPYIAVITSISMTLIIILALITFSDDVVLIYGSAAGYGTMCFLLVMLATCAAVIVFFRRNPGLESVGKAVIAPGLAFIGLGFVVVLALLHIDLMVGNKAAGMVFVAIVIAVIAIALGVARWLRLNRPDTYSRIGRQGEILK
ncbi:APC family permease [Rhodococcus sp. IEGM1428]|uniref:APC family permease n=1 Tax=Rhodococcus sp. IEGM1428 TaxID=3392191 RepID=UPI003D14786C